MVRRINAKFYTEEVVEIACAWLLANGISQETLDNFFFPLDDEQEDRILASFLESITLRQHRKPSVVIFVNRDIYE